MEHQSLTKDQQEKWEEKKLHAADRVEKLNAELNENLAGRIMAAFQDGVDMHCPHGLPIEQENGKKFPHYYTGLNAVLLATEMKEQKFYYPTFVDSRSIDAMQKDSLQVSRKRGSRGIRIHAPDFLAMTKSGVLLAIETKGDDRDNSDSRRKLELGKAWEGSAGGQYGYFMVFDKKPMEGAYAFEDFMDMVRDV